MKRLLTLFTIAVFATAVVILAGVYMQDERRTAQIPELLVKPEELRSVSYDNARRILDLVETVRDTGRQVVEPVLQEIKKRRDRKDEVPEERSAL